MLGIESEFAAKWTYTLFWQCEWIKNMNQVTHKKLLLIILIVHGRYTEGLVISSDLYKNCKVALNHDAQRPMPNKIS